MNISHAISYLYPDASPVDDFRVAVENGIQRIEYWGLPGKPPTQAELEAAWEEAQKLSYIDKRRSEYPPVGDQLDDLFKQGLFSERMAERIQMAKNTCPKTVV